MYISDQVNRHAWLSEAYFQNDMLEKGTSHRLASLDLVLQLSKLEPSNMRWTDQLMRTRMVVAEMHFEQGKEKEGQAQAGKALVIANRLVKHDPSNKRWATWKKRIMKMAK